MGLAWLVPPSSPPKDLHYIDERHIEQAQAQRAQQVQRYTWHVRPAMLINPVRTRVGAAARVSRVPHAVLAAASSAQRGGHCQKVQQLDSALPPSGAAPAASRLYHLQPVEKTRGVENYG